MLEADILKRNAVDCLSEEEMLAYLGTTLSDQARHTLEYHLNDCPFCSDALEGLELTGSSQHAEQLLKELPATFPNMQDAQNEPTARIRILFPWRIAAAFALLALSMATLFILKPDSSNRLAEAPDTTPKVKASGSPVVSSTEHAHTASDKPPVAEIDEVKDEPAPAEGSKTVVIADESTIPVTSEVLAEKKEQSETEDLNSDAGAASSYETDAVKALNVPSKESVSQGRSSVLSEVAVATKTKKSIDPPASSSLREGTAAYRRGDYGTAIQLLRKRDVLNNESSQIEAYWTLAQCYLKTGRIPEAREALTKIKGKPGNFGAMAQQQLDSLK
jgi:tetratricopeptide (TPR) repeat protein